MGVLKVKIETRKEKIARIIWEQFEDFAIETCKLSKEDIFDKAYEINVKTQIKDFFDMNELLDEDYEILEKANREDKGHLLDDLYSFYLNREFAKVDSFEDVQEWIEWFCDKKRSVENEI